MYPEFIESFNTNLKITYNLRDETQQGILPSRFARSRAGRAARQRQSMIRPPSDEEDGEKDCSSLDPGLLLVFIASLKPIF